MSHVVARSCLGLLAVSVLAVTSDGGTPIPTQYEVIDLGLLPGSFANSPEAINNKSEVVGWTHGPQTLYRAYVWRPGQGLVELPPPAGFTHNRATGISENGSICGVAQNGFDGTPHPWRLIDGVYEMLPTSANGCQPLFAHDVNDDGTVVGTVLATAPTCASTYAFYYSDADGMINIHALSALAINNAGVATGEGYPGAYRFTPATGIEMIGSLPPPYEHGEGRDINEQSNVVGRAIQHITGLDPWKAFFYSDATGMIEISPTLFARRSAEAVNNLDHAVGSDGTTSSPDQYPWIWSAESGRVALTQLVTLPPQYFNLNSPRGINDGDQIIARAVRQTGAEYDAVGLILVPSSSTSFCAGDGVDASVSTSCPCSNPGAVGRGCASSANPSGAKLAATGSAPADTLVLTSSGQVPNATSVFLQGDASLPAGSVFGDGVRCVAGALKRLYVVSASVDGSVSAPAAGQPSILARSAELGDPIAAGATRYYQVYYRDPDLAFCPSPAGSSFNVTNGLSVVW